MYETDDVLAEFRKGLNALRENDKNKINRLTFLARDYVHLPDFPTGVAEATILHVYETHANYKLLALYVIDSIVKNVEVPYREIYEASIVPAFVHAFKEIRDEATRKRLFNLRTTWKDIFPYSRMHTLDLKVRTHDPAWPLIPKEDELKTSIPLVPKMSSSKVAGKPNLAVGRQLTGPANEAVIAEARDPRRNRNRQIGGNASDGDFLIDRNGNEKMESIARRHGKAEEEVERQALRRARAMLPGKDEDMRLTSGQRPSSPKRVKMASPNEDVDMRVCTGGGGGGGGKGAIVSAMPPNAPLRPPTDVAEVRRMPPASVPPVHHMMPAALHVPLPRAPSLSTPPLPHCHRMGPAMLPNAPALETYPPPPPPPAAPPMRGYSNHAQHVPPIRGPIWTVEVDGLPEQISIGVDPRMLSRAPNAKAPSEITVDGRQYRLLLDRVQPLIEVENALHAVRFRCESLCFDIEGRRYVIPGTGFTRIFLAGRERIAYLGGPGHELVIDGRPHSIPFNSHYNTIALDNQNMSVTYACDLPQDVNVLPAIPPKILEWAYRGLFGSAGSLHLAPRNPLVEMERQAENRWENSGVVNARSRNQQAQRPFPADERRPQDVSSRNPSTVAGKPDGILPEVNVQELLSRLIERGVVSKPVPMPSLKKYDFEKFRQPYLREVDALYSGFQCIQCGIRFKEESSAEFSSHLDYHYMKNSAAQDEHRSRMYYQDSQCWLASGANEDLEGQNSNTPTNQPRELPSCPSFAEEKLNGCPVCGYKFDKFYDREEGEWMLENAVLSNGLAYHPICLEDADKGESEVEASHAASSEVTPLPAVAGEKVEAMMAAESEAEQQQKQQQQQHTVSIKPEAQEIECKIGPSSLNFCSSHSSGISAVGDEGRQLVLPPTKLMAAPSGSSSEPLSEVVGGRPPEEGKAVAVKAKDEEEEVKETVVVKREPEAPSLLLQQQPHSPPQSLPLPPTGPLGVLPGLDLLVAGETVSTTSLSFPTAAAGGSGGGGASGGVVKIPGLSPTGSEPGGETDEARSKGGSGSAGGHGVSSNGDGAGGEPVVTPDSISSNPLAALQAVLAGKAVLPGLKQD